MDLIVSNDGVTPSTDLYTSQCVAMDIVVLQNPPPTSKEVHSPLETRVYLVVPQGGATLAGDPNPCIRVCINFVFNKLASTLQERWGGGGGGAYEDWL